MELRHVTAFLTVAETLHFGRAAERLHMSQPALSLQIRSLEKEMGVRLFERDRRKTVLTPAGNLFRRESTEILERIDRAVRHARLIANGKMGTLRIGFISTAAREIVPSIIRAFRDAEPNIELLLRNILTMDQVRMLEAGTLDIGFLRLPVEHPELNIVTVHREPFVLVLPSSHRLAKQKRPLHLRELAAERFVMYRRDDAPGFHDLIMRILRDAQVAPTITQVAGDMHTLVSLVSAAMGLAILPSSTVRQGISGVVARSIKDELPLSTIGLATHKRNQDPVTLTFRAFALRVLQSD